MQLLLAVVLASVVIWCTVVKVSLLLSPSSDGSGTRISSKYLLDFPVLMKVHSAGNVCFQLP